jgi:hypothetical protein
MGLGTKTALIYFLEPKPKVLHESQDHPTLIITSIKISFIIGGTSPSLIPVAG